jgi:hypothetical protein
VRHAIPPPGADTAADTKKVDQPEKKKPRDEAGKPAENEK